MSQTHNHLSVLVLSLSHEKEITILIIYNHVHKDSKGNKLELRMKEKQEERKNSLVNRSISRIDNCWQFSLLPLSMEPSQNGDSRCKFNSEMGCGARGEVVHADCNGGERPRRRQQWRWWLLALRSSDAASSGAVRRLAFSL